MSTVKCFQALSQLAVGTGCLTKLYDHKNVVVIHGFYREDEHDNIIDYFKDFLVFDKFKPEVPRL